jgi:hypothetical protein
MSNRTLIVTAALGLVAFGGALYGKLGTTNASPQLAATTAPSVALVAAPAVLAAPPRSEDPDAARLAARRELYESVDAFLQASELEKARKLLDEDQARYGDDLAPQWRDLGQSYRLIADCLEKPTAQLRSRAQAFMLVSEAQSLKPRVLEACNGGKR